MKTKQKMQKKNTKPAKMPKTTKALAATISIVLIVFVCSAIWKPDRFEHLNSPEVFRASASFMVGLVLSTTALCVSLTFHRGDKEIRKRLLWILEIACCCILFAVVVFVLSLAPELTGNIYFILFAAFSIHLFYLIDLCFFIEKVRRKIGPEEQ